MRIRVKHRRHSQVAKRLSPISMQMGNAFQHRRK